MDNSSLVENVMTRMRSLPEFPTVKFMKRVFNKAIRSSTIGPFRGEIPFQEAFGPDQTSNRIDGINEKTILDALAVQTVVSTIGHLDGHVDKPNFRACVKAVCENNPA